MKPDVIAENLLPDHVRMIRIEEAQLRERRAKLVDFMGSMAWQNVDPDERCRMKRQLRAMTLYRDALVERIEATGVELLP